MQQTNEKSLMTKFTRCLFLLMFMVCASAAYAQGLKVSGTVVDDMGEPVIGASVTVQGTTNGCVTDVDGKYTLTKVAKNATLVFTYIGFTQQNVSVNGRTSLNVTMKEDQKTLDELVVVGYGSMKKSDLTGAMSRITSKQIQERPVQNALQAMQGKTPGVDVTSNNRPGELGDIRIRGNRSLLADNTPLYVIDGIPLTAGSMADINPSDIERWKSSRMLLLLLSMVLVVPMVLFLSPPRRLRLVVFLLIMMDHTLGQTSILLPII